MKPFKSLLYAFLGLLLFGSQGQGQTPDVIPKIESEYGISVRPGGNTFPLRRGFSTFLTPIVADSTLIFYYDVLGKRYIIDFSKFGGSGISYTPGVGLTMNSGVWSVKQWPSGSLGNIGVDGLYWATLPSIVSAEALNLSNGYFLMNLGNSTVRMPLGDYKNYLAQSFGVGSGGGSASESGLNWVEFPPENQNAPGKTNDIKFFEGSLYLKSPTQWYKINDVDSVFTLAFTPPATNVPSFSSSYIPGQNAIASNWAYTNTDVISWDLFFSPNDSLHFELLKGGIPAGDRSYSFAHIGGISKYYLTVRGQKGGGQLTPFSRKAEVVIPTQTGYQPVTNVAINPRNGQNSFDFFFVPAETGGIATLYISTNVNASAASADGWTKVSDITVTDVRPYSILVSGVNDTQARVFKIQRSGGNLSPSAFQKFGPASLSSTFQPLNAPTLSASVSGNSVTLAYNTNNSNVTTAIIQRSADNGATWPKSITVPPLNGAGYANDTDVTPGSTYQYRFYVTKDGQNSPFGVPAYASIPSQGVEPVPVPTLWGELGIYGDPNYQYATGPVFAQIGYSPVSSAQIPTDWEYKVGNGNWTAAEQGINNRNYLKFSASKEVHAGLTVRYRVRNHRLSDNKYSLYSNVTKVVFGNFGSEPASQRWTAFTVTTEPADQTAVGSGGGGSLDTPLQASLISQTTSAVTIAFSNQSSNRAYNASIYRGDPNSPGSFVDGWFNLQASGNQLTIDLSRVALTPGQVYRIYPAEYNGEPALQKQTRGGQYVEFVRTTGDQTGTREDKILIFGNSITAHGVANDIGWPNDWGMAASSRSKTYVRLLSDQLGELNILNSVAYGGGNGHRWELDFDQNFNYSALLGGEYKPTIVLLRYGDNVDDSVVESRNMAQYLEQFIETFRADNPNIAFLITTSYWAGHTKFDQMVKAFVTTNSTTASPIVLVDLAGLDTPENDAHLLYPNADYAVQRHPGDKGMQAIANKIFAGYQQLAGLMTNPGNPGGGTSEGRPVTWTRTGQNGFQNLGDVVIMQTPNAKIGVGMNHGGSLVYYSDMSGGSTDNMINNFDQGRQIQASYYAGPDKFTPVKPNGELWQKSGDPTYKDFPWNPVQAGDAFGNRARIDQVIYPSADNNWTLYVKSYAYNWAFNGYAPDGINGYKGDHIMESWYQFVDDDFLKVRYKITTQRLDGFTHDNASAGAQERAEYPAVYLERQYEHYWANTNHDAINGSPQYLNSLDPAKPINPAPSHIIGTAWPLKDYWFSASRTASPDDKGFGLVMMNSHAERPCKCYLTASFGLVGTGIGYQGYNLSYMNFSSPPMQLYGVGASEEYTFGVGRLSANETRAKYVKWGQPHGTDKTTAPVSGSGGGEEESDKIIEFKPAKEGEFKPEGEDSTIRYTKRPMLNGNQAA